MSSSRSHKLLYSETRSARQGRSEINRRTNSAVEPRMSTTTCTKSYGESPECLHDALFVGSVVSEAREVVVGRSLSKDPFAYPENGPVRIKDYGCWRKLSSSSGAGASR